MATALAGGAARRCSPALRFTPSLRSLCARLVPMRHDVHNAAATVPMHSIVEPSPRSVGIYVHWPYCKSKCTYCDFNRYIRESVDHARMRRCLTTELGSVLDECDIASVHSIFFGGGTPTLTEPETIQAVVETVVGRGLAVSGDSIEITMEGNPTSIEATKLEAFRRAGVNRLSLGVQALSHARDLAVLGRNHSVDEAVKALEIARELFPGHYSFDLIFGRPSQRVDAWRDELGRALQLAGGHLSLYQLTLEKGTPLYKQHKAGLLQMPDEDAMAELFDTAVETLQQHGYSQYEVSNFAVPGAECRHNLAYWQGLDYLGIGPGAHSRLTPGITGVRAARIQTLRPEDWMNAVERNGNGVRQDTPQTASDYAGEALMLGLRTRAGVSAESFSRALGREQAGLDSLASIASSPQCRHLFDEGYLAFDGESVRATEKGLRILDALLPPLLSALDAYLGETGATPARVHAHDIRMSVLTAAGCGGEMGPEN